MTNAPDLTQPGERDDAHVMKLWRECGLPQYFIGNGGTNHRLLAFYKAAYKEGWNDREGDLLAGIDRVYGAETVDDVAAREMRHQPLAEDHPPSEVRGDQGAVLWCVAFGKSALSRWTYHTKAEAEKACREEHAPEKARPVPLYLHPPSPPALPEGWVAALEEIRDLLMERVHGNSARSPAHNARLKVEALLAASPPIPKKEG